MFFIIDIHSDKMIFTSKASFILVAFSLHRSNKFLSDKILKIASLIANGTINYEDLSEDMKQQLKERQED